MDMVQLTGYQILEQLYTGPKTLVYRGRRNTDNCPVIIKLLQKEYPSFGELIQFRNQYNITKNLSLPNITHAYALEIYRNGYALVMEDFGGISLKQWLRSQQQQLYENTPRFLNDFLRIAVQLAAILNDLYHHRVIHKDIKPTNILINPETKQVKLIDFSIASLLPRETQSIQHPNFLEGTLAYLSPEQTGRMNRGVDYRTDFYSLGVTFYEMLTGQLPFYSTDPMELVHCHIAKVPPSVQTINPNIPGMLSQIVAKLMAKNAEERYQSAIGLKHDLEICLHQFQKTGSIEVFTLGKRDMSDRFLIPEKLYGREPEVNTLLNAFQRVAQGHAELMLVAGFSGIGKTAVINEVHKPIVQQRGYFIKGKFNQFNRNVPFSAFVQAFRDLMGQLLCESDGQLQEWKTRLVEALGTNGQVIVDVIPELERIIGPQPAVPELSGLAAQNRFNLLFHRFIQVFATHDHPLVIVLDDLQWADSASLKLMQLLMGEAQHGYLLVIGAYRDNEVSPAHPLMLTLNEIRKSDVTQTTITLAPLDLASLNHLVVDTLTCSPEAAQPLTDLIYQKTHGNPFFATQFLKALYQDGLIIFDRESGYWQCDITTVREAALTDDVVAFMAQQLQKLPLETQDVLKLAACIGNQFDLSTLAMVSTGAEADTAVALWRSLQEGLILPQSEVYKFYVEPTQPLPLTVSQTATYRFLHDRVQQAAYSLIPAAERAIVHYQIGQLLLQQISPDAQDERIFELVNQLNYGTYLNIEQSKRDELAHLNLVAARKARTATAYQAARDYATTGLFLLGDRAWQRQYDLTLRLHGLAAEVAWLVGDFEQMDQWIGAVMHHANTPLEKVPVYQVKIQALNSRNEFLEAIATGKAVLQQLGIHLPDACTPDDVQQARQEINALIGDRSIEDLVHLPSMSDPQQLAIMQIADSMMPACYMTGSPIYPLVVALQVKQSIQYGNSLFSPVGYVSYAFQLHSLRQAMSEVEQFGQLAYRLASEPSAKSIRAATFNIFAGYIHHCTAPLRETLPIFREGYQAGLETGDLEFTIYIVQVFSLNAFWSGQPLIELEPQIRAYHQQLCDLNLVTTAKHYFIYWETALILMGHSEEDIDLRHDAYEAQLLADVQLSNDVFRRCVFYFHRCVLNLWLGDLDQAQLDAAQTRQHLNACVGTIIEPVFYFYDSLIVLATLPYAAPSPTDQLQRVQDNQIKLHHWAHHAPMNHLHKWHLVEAERYRVLGNRQAAIELYDLAIKGAKQHEYLQEEALANELAAQFYWAWGKEKVAAGYLQEAYYGYARWGAVAKTNDLEQRYPEALQPILTQDGGRPTSGTIHSTTTSSSSSSADSLDLAAVIKASQVISGELLPDQLIVTLMQLVVENAGAERGALILRKAEQLVLVAQCSNGQDCHLQSTAVEISETIPKTLVNYVFRTAQTFVVDDMNAVHQFAADPYIMQQRPRSVLCLPLMKQNQPIGVIYLENNLIAAAFTGDRVNVLNVLCTQAAISFENANLYETLQISHRTLQQSLETLRKTQEELVQATEKLQYDAFHDTLTNLPNRAWFMNLLEHAILLHQRHPNSLYAVLFLDLDRFKMVNDSLGHVVGDELLKNVAQRLLTCVRESDTVARFGGDEFAILLEGLTEIDEVIAIARRIHEQLALPFDVDGYEVFTATSIGITLSTIDYEQAANVLRDADTAMYHAKSQGRNQYALFDPSMQTQVTTRLQLESDLCRALEAQEFCLHYQPIIALSTGCLRGFEALIRWNHPKRGMILPSEFISVAEETGMIVALGQWVLNEACNQLHNWLTQFPQASHLVMTVNLSAIQLRQTDLLERLEAILHNTQIPRQCLRLEITESCILETFTSEAQRLKQLKDLGIRLCIDDFGTGYSSLSRLHEFPIDTLKIDRTFVNRLSANASETVQMIVTLAHGLGMDVVAEGIETLAQLETLKMLGCEFGQGFLFAQPLNLHQANEWVQASIPPWDFSGDLQPPR